MRGETLLPLELLNMVLGGQLPALRGFIHQKHGKIFIYKCSKICLVLILKVCISICSWKRTSFWFWKTFAHFREVQDDLVMRLWLLKGLVHFLELFCGSTLSIPQINFTIHETTAFQLVDLIFSVCIEATSAEVISMFLVKSCKASWWIKVLICCFLHWLGGRFFSSYVMIGIVTFTNNSAIFMCQSNRIRPFLL